MGLSAPLRQISNAVSAHEQTTPSKTDRDSRRFDEVRAAASGKSRNVRLSLTDSRPVREVFPTLAPPEINRRIGRAIKAPSRTETTEQIRCNSPFFFRLNSTLASDDGQPRLPIGNATITVATPRSNSCAIEQGKQCGTEPDAFCPIGAAPLHSRILRRGD